jgi:hypothetical protein
MVFEERLRAPAVSLHTYHAKVDRDLAHLIAHLSRDYLQLSIPGKTAKHLPALAVPHEANQAGHRSRSQATKPEILFLPVPRYEVTFLFRE